MLRGGSGRPVGAPGALPTAGRGRVPPRVVVCCRWPVPGAAADCGLDPVHRFRAAREHAVLPSPRPCSPAV